MKLSLLEVMEYSPPPLFKQGAPARVKVTVFALLSIALLVVDARFHALTAVRQVAATVLYSFTDGRPDAARRDEQHGQLFLIDLRAAERSPRPEEPAGGDGPGHAAGPAPDGRERSPAQA
jgi:hypothetical protein